MKKTPFWSPIVKRIATRQMLLCVLMGFASGLPLYVLIQLVPAMLRKENVSLAAIGFFSLIHLPYTWKFLWSPLMDRFSLPFLGRRTGWMLVSQIILFLMIGCLGIYKPAESVWMIAIFSTLVAFFSASQDIVLDAFRRELLSDEELGLGNSIHVTAYRLAGLIPGSLSFILADHLPWSSVFWITASFMLVGIVLSFIARERVSKNPGPRTLREAVVEPFHDFFQRNGKNQAILILCFMFLYKLGDSMATALSSPFYIDMGFSLTDIGLIAKHAALWPSIIGGLLGGILMLKIGINRALWLFGLVQMITILGFAALSEMGANKWMLALVVGAEYLGIGLGTAAFVAFIQRCTSAQFAATQIALFTALTALPRTFANATTGFIVESMGWTSFFLLCTLLAVPGMLLLLKIAPWNEPGTDQSQSSDSDSDAPLPEEETIELRFDGGTEYDHRNSSSDMDVGEALTILGLPSGASKAEIIATHRRLMQKVHPDRGGNNYLAAKINQAKEFLITKPN